MTDEHSTAADQRSARAVSQGGRIVLVLALVTLCWYLLADRYTPYTNQARIQGYVVGIAPKVSGLVTRVDVANNTRVEAGQPLFQIDDADYQLALERARSELDNATKQVAAGDASVTAARARLDAALANQTKAKQDYDRLNRLFESDPGAISVRRLEISKASLESAVANVAAARADIQRAIDTMGGDNDADNTILRTAQSAVDKAELDLANTLVRAPQRGVITDLRTDVGLYAGTGNPVMTLVAVEDVWVLADFTENNLGRLRTGMPAEISFDVLPGRVFSGSVRSLGLGVSVGSLPPPGTLPTVQNNRDWLRQAQRFPVEINVDAIDDPEVLAQLRIGGQASVIAYSEPPWPLRGIGELYMRLMAWLSYAY